VAERRPHLPGHHGGARQTQRAVVLSGVSFEPPPRAAANDNRRAWRDRLKVLWPLLAAAGGLLGLWAAGIR
jgi:hypothetical protein